MFVSLLVLQETSAPLAEQLLNANVRAFALSLCCLLFLALIIGPHLQLQQLAWLQAIIKPTALVEQN